VIATGFEKTEKSNTRKKEESNSRPGFSDTEIDIPAFLRRRRAGQ
jgi:hypothetical protein